MMLSDAVVQGKPPEKAPKGIRVEHYIICKKNMGACLWNTRSNRFISPMLRTRDGATGYPIILDGIRRIMTEQELFHLADAYNDDES
jgi:hypothetical protein